MGQAHTAGNVREPHTVCVSGVAAATGVESARWEMFQLEHLCDDGTFRIENKSRQIAWSWLAAAEAIVEAVLYGQSSIFVSINQAEAGEKIRYAKLVLQSLRVRRLPGVRLGPVIDPLTGSAVCPPLACTGCTEIGE